MVTAPRVLLEVLQHPHSDMLAAIIDAITTATDERLRSEADREGARTTGVQTRHEPGPHEPQTVGAAQDSMLNRTGGF